MCRIYEKEICLPGGILNRIEKTRKKNANTFYGVVDLTASGMGGRAVSRYVLLCSKLAIFFPPTKDMEH